MSALKHHADLNGSILYTTSPPCPKCAQMIVQSGIKYVVYGKKKETCEARDEEMKQKAVDIFYEAKIATL